MGTPTHTLSEVRMSGSWVLLSIMPCLLMTSLVSGGCSFKDQMESTRSSFQDLDQAKLAAKMALAHKGLDIEVLKKRQASSDNETTERRKEHAKKETYIPTYVTAENGNQEENVKKERTVEE